LGELSAGEVEELKEYETKNQKRYAMVKRLDRSLVQPSQRVRGQERALHQDKRVLTLRDPVRGERGQGTTTHLPAGVWREGAAVFSSEMVAWGFLRFSDLGSEWHIRESHSGELVSLLLGPYTNVTWILPNPLPEPLAAEDTLLNLLYRGWFLRFLLARGKGPPGLARHA